MACLIRQVVNISLLFPEGFTVSMVDIGSELTDYNEKVGNGKKGLTT